MFRCSTPNAALAALLCFPVLCLSVATPARAEMQPSIRFSKLPESDVALRLSANAPARIDTSEHATGFILSASRSRDLFLSGTKLIVDRGIDAESLPQNVCFANGRVDRNAELTTEFPVPEDLEVFASLPTMFGSGQPSQIIAARMQKLTRSGADATLDLRDAWIDPSTRGARLIRKKSLAFQRVRAFVGGVDVYASRDHGSVHFIVAQPEVSPPVTGAPGASNAPGAPGLNRNRRPIVSEREEGSASAQFCDHLRVTLVAERGEGSKVTVRVPVVLGRERLKLPPPEKEGEPLASPMIEERFRELGIHLSTSWFSKDVEPVISVTAGWLSRERKERSSEPTATTGE
jgi:hypothetical protein